MFDLNEEINRNLWNQYAEPDHRVHLLTERHSIIPGTWNVMSRSLL